MKFEELGPQAMPGASPEEQTIATLAGVRRSAPQVFLPNDRLADVMHHFDQMPEAIGALVAFENAPAYVILRDWAVEHLAKPFFRECFFHRPLSELRRVYPNTVLELPDRTPVTGAIERALARAAAERYQPIVVLTADQSRWLLDMNTLLLQQCQFLASTLQHLEEQRKATLAAQAEREQLQQRFAAASREAGRAEVATGILHNIGNVLNSVIVSASVINKTLQQSKLPNLSKSAALLQEHAGNLTAFLTEDERGRRLGGYLTKVAGVLEQEHAGLAQEMANVERNLEHIRHVVSMQQSYAKGSTLRESARPADLFEDALRVNLVSFERHNVQVERQYEEVGPVPLDKHKVLQILINLVSNAKNAVKERSPQDKRIILKIARFERDGTPQVRFGVVDNGIGIPPENLTRIFTMGFTTRKGGHGFGLHTASNAAREMGGRLAVFSAGANAGATLTLEVPVIENGSIATEPGKVAA